MRNLKKVLALVLALVMAMSLVTIANAASFSDQDDIEYTEAVDVLTALGVIEGVGNNTFNPTGNVTRAQMAKMITIVALGNVSADAFLGTTTDLTDIDGHWAEAYIKYCYSQGIISGKGAGIFDPNANVTCAEAAKMLLVAIGYNSDVQGYTGAQWAINVQRDATISKFYNDLAVPATQDLTRDQAAQLIYNAVQADTIEKESSVDRETGNITDIYTPDGPTLLEETFNVVEVEGTMTDSVKQLSGVRAGTYTVDIERTSYHSAATDFSALLGQEVVLMYQDKDGDGAQDSNEPVFGVYAKYTDAATGLLAQSGITKASDKSVKCDGVTYKLDAATINTMSVAVDGTITAGTVTAAGLEVANSYAAVRLVDSDSDADYDLAIIYAADAQKVTYADKDKVIAGANTYKFEDNTIESGVAKDDYVSIAWDFASGMTALSILEKQSGKVTAINTADTLAQVNDEWIYNRGTAMAIDNTYDYYVLNGVLVYAKQTTSADMSNLVFVSDVDTTTVNKEARVYYVDGTSKVITVDQTSTGYVVPAPGNFYTVSETDYGFKFKTLASYTSYETKDAIYTDYTYDNASAVADADRDNDGEAVATINGKQIADDAVIFVLGKVSGGTAADTAKVITGEQLKSLTVNGTASDDIETSGIGSFMKKVNGLEKITVAAVTWKSSDASDAYKNFNATSAAGNYGIVVDKPITVANGYIQYTIWNGSENITVVDKSTALSAISKFSVVGYSSIDSDGYIKDADVAKFANTTANTAADSIGAGALTGYEKDNNGYYVLTVDGSKVFNTDNKTVYLYMNSSAETAAEVGLAGEGVTLADTVYGFNCENMIVYTDSSAASTARVVIFDVTNRLDLSAAQQFTLTVPAANIQVTDADGNVLGNTDKVQAGQLLTITNTSASSQALDTGLAYDITTNAKYDGSLAAGASVIVVVTNNNITIANS